MQSNTRALATPGRRGALEASATLVGKSLATTLLSPSIVFAGMVQVLCHPVTRRWLFGAVILDIPLQWGMHLDMTQGVAESMGALDGFDFSITTLALIGLYLGWLFTERASGRPLRMVWNWPIAAYTLVVVASIFVASNVQLSMFQIVMMLEMLLVYIYAAANIRSRDDIVFVLYLILVGGLIESSYILLLNLVGHDLPIVRALGFKTVITRSNIPGEAMRFGGTIGQANYAAAYLAIVITIGLAVRRMCVPGYLRRLTFPLIILAAAALITTLSRGGWLEVILSVAIFAIAIWARNGGSLKGVVVGSIAALIVTLCLFVANPISRRLSENDNGSAYSRIPLMHLADSMIEANPFLGVGANNFAVVMKQYEGSEFRHAWLYTVHNEFLLVCSETGIIGLLFYLWIYLDILRRGWRLWRNRDAMFAPLGLGICAAVCGLMSHMLVDIFSDRGLIQLVWVFAAMTAACEIIRLSENSQDAAVMLGASIRPEKRQVLFQ